MRIGVVGLGFMGSTHLEAYQQVRDFELAAVASSSAQKLAGDLSDTGGNLDRGGGKMDFGSAACYKTAADLIADPNVEAVDLCTPTHLHKELVLRTLAAGKHVLVEKPMALSVSDCMSMIEASSQANRVLMVAQVLRFFPEYATARRMVNSGELGKVCGAWFRRRCAAPAWGGWLKDRSCSGGGVLDLLIHDFDFCRHLFGKPRTVSATGHEDLDAGIDVVEAQLDYFDGVPVSISGGWHHPESFPFSMEFTIVCDATARRMVNSGELGKVYGAWFRRRCAAPAWGGWLKDRSCSGGGVLDLLIHDFDFCRHLFGKPRTVSATGHEDLDAGIDVVEAQLDYFDGVPVSISGGWHHPESFPFSMEFTIVCEKATLDYSSDKTGLRQYGEDGKLVEIELPQLDGFVAELQAFVDACNQNVVPVICPPEESAESIGMVLAMSRSREQGGVPIPVE